MKGCNEIKRLIDEADQPEMLTFEVSGHIAHCQACRNFAGERASLRKLVASGARVTAPMNFDAMLGERLAQAKARKTFSWLSPAAFMRLGAAAAGLVIALLVIQYTGLLSPEPQNENKVAVTPPALRAPASGPAASPVESKPQVVHPSQSLLSDPALASMPRPSRGPVRREVVAAQPVASGDYTGIEDGGVILVRGQNGEREVPMPTVSVGAQPLLYVNSTRPAPRNAGTSF